MKVLVIGSGGREHAICYAFSKSNSIKKIYCANGNAGISSLAECINIKPDEIDALADFAETNNIDLTFVGGETALALGIADVFASRKLKIIGVSKQAAMLESSKSFAKDFMKRHGIPTADFHTAFSTDEAADVLNTGRFGDESSPVVIKADGLAAGKGVVVAADRAEALMAVDELEVLAGKDASEKIVIEECLFGREVSLILFSDGANFALMPPTRDHKRVGEGDKGPNTGGMGTFTDDSLLSSEQIEQIIEKIIKPSLKGCREEGFPFKGIMFLGLMLTSEDSVTEAKVLEYNVRFGDPETQSILVRLDSDLAEICLALLDEKLDEIEIKWQPGNSACVILAAENYPAKPRTGELIDGLDAAEDSADVVIFHSGTSFQKLESEQTSNRFITSGGRVLGVTAVGDSLEEALDKAYRTVDGISWKGMQYRRDIGRT